MTDDPTINVELALPIRSGEQGWAVHVAVIGKGWRDCTPWRATFGEALQDRNSLLAALDQEAA